MKIKQRLAMIEMRQIAQWWDNFMYFITIITMIMLLFILLSSASQPRLGLAIILIVLYVLLLFVIQICEKEEIRGLKEEYENQKKANKSAA